MRPTIALAALLFAVVPGCSPSGAATRDTTGATPTPPKRALRPARVATADSAMVVSASALATNAGLDVLRHGGNAVDAAVTVALTLAVTYPAAGNIGGGGFMVAHINGKNVALDFREAAPRAATRDMYLDSAGNMTDRSVTGALAAGVPGSVAGLYEAHRKYGTKPWRSWCARPWSSPSEASSSTPRSPMTMKMAPSASRRTRRAPRCSCATASLFPSATPGARRSSRRCCGALPSVVVTDSTRARRRT